MNTPNTSSGELLDASGHPIQEPDVQFWMPTDEELGEYLTQMARPDRGFLRKHLSPAQMLQAEEKLCRGEDPLFVAMKLRADFTCVARLADNVLQGELGRRKEPYIPLTLMDYLWFASALEQKAAGEMGKIETTMAKIRLGFQKLAAAMTEGAKNL